jgi:predicted transcriptional regulator
MISFMARKMFLGIRIDPELKRTLEEIGDAEARSVSQVCELLLGKGVDAYKKEGAKYLQRTSSRHKKELSD